VTRRNILESILGSPRNVQYRKREALHNLKTVERRYIVGVLGFSQSRRLHFLDLCTRNCVSLTVAMSTTTMATATQGTPSQGPITIAVSAVFLGINAFFIGLRCYSQARIAKKFDFNDVFMIGAVVRQAL
jgi:hypothetical protein